MDDVDQLLSLAPGSFDDRPKSGCPVDGIRVRRLRGGVDGSDGSRRQPVCPAVVRDAATSSEYITKLDQEGQDSGRCS